MFLRCRIDVKDTHRKRNLLFHKQRFISIGKLNEKKSLFHFVSFMKNVFRFGELSSEKKISSFIQRISIVDEEIHHQLTRRWEETLLLRRTSDNCRSRSSVFFAFWGLFSSPDQTFHLHKSKRRTFVFQLNEWLVRPNNRHANQWLKCQSLIVICLWTSVSHIEETLAKLLFFRKVSVILWRMCVLHWEKIVVKVHGESLPSVPLEKWKISEITGKRKVPRRSDLWHWKGMLKSKFFLFFHKDSIVQCRIGLSDLWDVRLSPILIRMIIFLSCKISFHIDLFCWSVGVKEFLSCTRYGGVIVVDLCC